ncbi:MAG: DUF169 domain-containing protein [Syntrophobacteraceae bacterium]|nr:DUF169 domain-containing protein [Syntrophobacteraceae bacterium]
MGETSFPDSAAFIRDNLRLKSFPVAVKFLKEGEKFPEKARRPSVSMGKKITICQGVTMARNYGWTVGLTREDVICVPAAIVFGLSKSADPQASLSRLYWEASFASTQELASKEVATMSRFENGEIAGILMAPAELASFAADTSVLYGNPAQVMRLAQAWSYITGTRCLGACGGKVECDEYLISPYKEQSARMAVPGNGERIFAGTQDDEMTFALPGGLLPEVAKGLKEAGKAIGARYPVTPYQNFEPEFPKSYKVLGKEIGIV